MPPMRTMPADHVMKLESGVVCRLRGQVRDFRLVVTDEGILLRGRSCTYYAKQLAQHAVMQMTAIPILANEIEVARQSVLNPGGQP